MRKSSNLHVLGFSSLEECGLLSSDSDGSSTIIPGRCALSDTISAVRSVRSDAESIKEEMACCDTNAAICAAVLGCMMASAEPTETPWSRDVLLAKRDIGGEPIEMDRRASGTGSWVGLKVTRGAGDSPASRPDKCSEVS